MSDILDLKVAYSDFWTQNVWTKKIRLKNLDVTMLTQKCGPDS